MSFNINSFSINLPELISFDGCEFEKTSAYIIKLMIYKGVRKNYLLNNQSIIS